MNFARRAFLAAVLCIGVGLTAAHSEIVKTANIDCQGRLCLYWWPRLAPLPGWHSDLNVNRHYNINALTPDGFTWQNAGTVMYANAVYKKSQPGLTSLDLFITHDAKTFAQGQAIQTGDAAPARTGDGEKLRSLTFFRPQQQSWERVSYGEDGDYYIIFVVNAHSEAAYAQGAGGI